MPIKFLGFATASQVAIAAATALSSTGAVTVDSWGNAAVSEITGWSGPPADETLTVTVAEVYPGGRNFTPLPVEFRISVTGSPVGDSPANIELETDFAAFDPTFSGIHHVTHTGDTGTYRNTRLAHASHGSKAVQYGPNPGHVYSNPGTYTGRSVYVYDEHGNWGTATLPDLVAVDPDVAFQTSDVVVVSNDPNEDWSTAPPHDPANRCTTMDAAMARFYDLRLGSADGDGVRVSAKPGTVYNEIAQSPNVDYMNGRALFDTWDQTGTILIDEGAVVGGSSTGDFFTNNGGTDEVWPIAVKGWQFDFGFDVTSGGPKTGDWTQERSRGLYSLRERLFPTFTGDGIDTFDVVGQRPVFDNVDVKGCAHRVLTGISTSDLRRNNAWFLNDCLFYDNNDYLLFQSSNLFFLGSQMLETYGTELGLMGRTRLSGSQRGFRGHRNVRESQNWMIYIRATFMETRGGWSGQNGGSTLYAPQPLNRFHESNGGFRDGKRIYICDSVMSGAMGPGSQGNNALTHLVIENSLMVHDPAQAEDYMIRAFSGGQTLRNNLWIVLNTPRMGRASDPETAGKNLDKFEVNASNVRIGTLAMMIRGEYGSTTVGRPLEFLHNTMIMLRADADIEGTFEFIEEDLTDYTGAPAGQGTASDVYDYIKGHNVFHAPNLSAPVGSAVTGTAMPSGVRVLDVWMKMIWELYEGTLAADVVDGATSEEFPYPNDWNNVQTTQSDYTGSNNNHAARIDGVDYCQLPNTSVSLAPAEWDSSGYNDAITVNFTATGFTLTNRSGVTWTAGSTLAIVLDRGSTSMSPDLLHTVDQTELQLYKPATAQAIDAGVKRLMFDFGRALRPQAGYAISPASGTDVAGAVA